MRLLRRQRERLVRWDNSDVSTYPGCSSVYVYLLGLFADTGFL
jgi:hypothetical protein